MQTLKTYPCGLRVVIDYMPNRNVENVSFFVASGSAYDLPNKDGIAHFYEHMFFKSTKNRSSYKVNLDLDLLGAGGNAYTSFDKTCYYSKVVKDKTEDLFDILSDCFFNGLFLDDEIQTEKGVVCSEIDKYEDDFADVAMNVFSEHYFAGTSFAHPILGSKESVMSITSEDLKKYREKNNTANRLIISVAGGVPPSEIERLVEKYVLKNLSGTQKPVVYTEIEPAKISLANHFAFTQKDTDQVYFFVGVPSPRSDNPDFLKSRMAAILLGGTMSSRLFQRLREKEGVVYSVWTALDSLSAGGTFNGFLLSNRETASRAIKAFGEEVKKVAVEGFTNEEIEQAKILAEANTRIVNDSIDARARINASSLLNEGKIYDEEKEVFDIKSLKTKEVNECIKNILRDENFFVSVVAKENDIDILKLLK